MTGHVPDRPGWRCRACGEGFPCVTRRAELHRTPDRIGAILYLATCFVEAVRDLPGESVAALHRRFLADFHPARGVAPPAPDRRPPGRFGRHG